jgi:hypothetical protein
MMTMTRRQHGDNHPGEERFLTDRGESDAIEPGTDDERTAPRRARGLGTAIPPEEKKDSGYFGAGRDNEGKDDDNLARETTPGYQADKGDKGTQMPR